jgi:LysM repeat protein
MSSIRQLISGILAALLTTGIVLGGFVLAFSERGVPVSGQFSSPTAPAESPTEALPSSTSIPTDLPRQTAAPTGLPTLTPTQAYSPTPPPAACQPPPGWSAVMVNPGENLAYFAQAYGTTTSSLAQANCLITESLISGSLLYVPPPPTAEPQAALPTSPPSPYPTAAVCRPPAGWVIYTVQRGDTLYRISQMYRTTVSQLRAANCLGSSSYIQAGQRLYVPNVPVSTAVPAPSLIPTLPPLPSDTPPPPPTAEPTAAIPPPTATEAPVPTSTATSAPPTPTATDLPIATPLPPTATEVPPATATQLPATPTATLPPEPDP